jgi:hypothetical protein
MRIRSNGFLVQTRLATGEGSHLERYTGDHRPLSQGRYRYDDAHPGQPGHWVAASGLGPPHTHLLLDWARRCHICFGTGLAAATSAPGLCSALPHPRRDWARPYPGRAGLTPRVQCERRRRAPARPRLIPGRPVPQHAGEPRPPIPPPPMPADEMARKAADDVRKMTGEDVSAITGTVCDSRRAPPHPLYLRHCRTLFVPHA